MNLDQIKDRIKTIRTRNEIVNGYQPWGYTDESKEKEIYFTGFEDGRAMMIIDLLDLEKKI